MELEEVFYSSSKKCKHSDFHFIPPPEAPIFEPTLVEFQDPISYINSIKDIAEKTGICKIRPPPEWQPPFALDIEKFKFTPRLQRLNELEAKTRIKLNFLDQIAKFWELQGCSLKIPMVERRILDLYSLHQHVKEEGGFSVAAREKKWYSIALKMNYVHSKNTATLLRSHYERILYPYDVFKEREMPEKKAVNSMLARVNPVHMSSCNDSEEKFKAEDSGTIKNLQYNYNFESACSKTFNKENRLKFYGRGSKMVGCNTKQPNKDKLEHSNLDPLAKYICKNCLRGDIEESMLLCDGCDDSYHTFCLMPPLAEVPKGDWRCPKCIANEVKKPTEAFGFEQAQQEYSLHQFGEMADRFKSDYFNMPVHRVPTPLVEKEFWRLVSSIDEDVCVEYGADLHSVEHGSGFPTKRTSNLDEDPSLKVYVDSGWNLNNIPILEDSVLSFINADISGMKVPWMYVGMCFSTFCWHNEDHWSYSINYLHWGEPKTWYGVPGCQADVFECCMKNAAPELFDNQPDLLHQLVTILNPNVLMKAGVPVYRTDQQAGEFVITFPRAYHAGFNQGYNFAEAVNFAPVDWLKMGRECINYYSNLRRYCVFSHDELVCKMAMDAENLHPRTAAATYKDVLCMVESEKKLRKSLLDWGVRDAELEAFELLPDDERQCEVCKTTCFLSAVTCSCSTSRLVCLRHYSSHCPCPPKKHILRYRYSLDEFPEMLQRLKSRAESYEEWLKASTSALDKSSATPLDELLKLMNAAIVNTYPESKVKEQLFKEAREARHCSELASELLQKKNSERMNPDSGALSFGDLLIFCDKLQSFSCLIPELKLIQEWTDDAKRFMQKACQIIIEDSLNLQEIIDCWLQGLALHLDIKEFDYLQSRLDLVSWINLSSNILNGATKYEISEIENAIGEIEDIKVPARFSEKVNSLLQSLKKMLQNAKKWEERAKVAVNKPRPSQKLDYFEDLMNSGVEMNVELPSIYQLMSKVRSIKNIIAHADDIINSNKKYCLTDVKDMIKKIQSIPVNSAAYVSKLQKKTSDTEFWLREMNDIFLLEGSKLTLLEALCPLIDERLSSKKIADMEILTNDIRKLHTELKNGHVAKDLISIAVNAVKNQINNLKCVQLFNMRKKGNAEFCVCRHQQKGLMYECSLCKDWFHEVCVPLISIIKNQLDSYGFDLKFICTYCERTKRPTPLQVVNLLVKYERIGLIIPEGEALKLLFDRCLDFQVRCRDLLLTRELKSAAKILINCRASIDEQYILPDKDSFNFSDEIDCGVNLELLLRANKSEDIVCSSQDHSINYVNLDHNYFAGAMDVFRKHNRKSPIKPRECSDDILPVHLSKNCILSLKELFNEGGCVELQLNENQLIWRLLQASVPHKVQKYFGVSKNNVAGKSSNFKKQPASEFEKKPDNFGKKRKLEELYLTPVKKNKKDKSQTSASGLKKISHANNGKKLKKDKPLISGKKVNKKEVIDGKKPVVKNDQLVNQMKKKEKKEIGAPSKKKTASEVCAAAACSQPFGKKINWVQCDGTCNAWFHVTCVGLTAKDLKTIDKYFCMDCSIIKEKS